MLTKKYDSLVTELNSFILKHDELTAIKSNAEFDLKWRLAQLYKEVSEDDEQKFIDISGMQAHLSTSGQKRELAKREKEIEQQQETLEQGLSELTQVEKIQQIKNGQNYYIEEQLEDVTQTLKVSDDDYKEELTEIYKNITESYENSNLDVLMVETYKLFIKPKEVINDQIEILEESKQSYHKKIKDILSSQGFIWSTFNDNLKENFLINLMKQQGVRFVDRIKVKEVLNRKISSRKTGQKPKNKLRDRVKNKI